MKKRLISLFLVIMTIVCVVPVYADVALTEVQNSIECTDTTNINDESMLKADFPCCPGGRSIYLGVMHGNINGKIAVYLVYTCSTCGAYTDFKFVGYL